MKRSIVSLRSGNVLRPITLVAACLAWVCTPVQAQFRSPHRQGLPDFDSRAPSALKSARLTERQGGQSRLAGQLPSAVVDFEPLLDSPKFVHSQDGFLTGPNGRGRSVAASTLDAIPANDPYRPIKAFLNEHSAIFGHGAEALEGARIKRDYVDAHNGLHTIVWEQEFDGIPVFQALLSGHITRKGELTSLASRFLPDLTAAADAGTPGRSAFQSAPPVSAPQAIVMAGENIGAGLAAADVVPAGGPVGGYLLYRTPQPASARLVWFPLHRSALRLAWEVIVMNRSTHDSFQLVVDAKTGKALYRMNLTCHISDATYTVYDSYSPSPFGPSLQVPGNFQPPLTNRNTYTYAALVTNASPQGWIPDGGNTTTGNNIDAFLDRNFDGAPDQPRPQGTNRVFTFPLDLTQDPTNYIDAATVQLFWRGNWYHDRLYQLGFTEAAGNFQDNNFGRGGLGNDHIICYVEAGADVGLTDNSMFGTAPDGQSGQCYMFIFTGTDPFRDGSLDQEVVTHEFTHGTSWRLVGGGMVLGSLQGNGMGEGWSDFYSEALLNPADADPDAAYASGGYVTYLFAGTGFDQNYYFGIRRYPYSTDILKNPLTFKDIDPAQALAHKEAPLSPLFSPFDPRMADEVHNQGEVWCVTLWEMHANLVHKYGWAIGNELTLQLATDGMKLTPGFPNFLQARDAILLADQIDNGGANQTEIWQAFAKRGMGFSATSPDGSTTAGVHEAYDVPLVGTLGLNVSSYRVFGGNGNGIIEFNECNSLNLVLTNIGTVNATFVSATLATVTPGVAIANATSDYGDIPLGSSGTNLVPFQISTSPSFVCGTPIEISVQIASDQGLGFALLTLPTGVPGEPLRFDNNSLVPIPSPGVTNSAVVVSNVNFAVQKVTVSMFVEELFDYYLRLELIAPDGTTNLLSANNGFTGANYGFACAPETSRTTFDDAAELPITSGVPPFLGSFKPQQPLSGFIGKSGTNINGVWRLQAKDDYGVPTGVIHCWSLFLTPTLCTDGGGQCPGADMTIGMTGTPGTVIAGNNLTYNIAVTNRGPSVTTNVTVTHLLPPNVTFVSASTSQGSYSQQGGVVTFSLGAMVPRASARLSVIVQPNDTGAKYTMHSTASVASEQPDPIPGNNSATATTQVTQATADLAVGIAAVPNPALVGGTLTYTVSLANNGPSPVAASPTNALIVTNALPASVQVKSVAVSRGTTTFLGNVVLWSLTNKFSAGASATATITVSPTVEGLITATASTGAREADPVAANNIASVTTTVGPAADLAVSVTDYRDPTVAGSNVTYEVVVTNRGPSKATSVTVHQALPTPVILVSTNTSQGTASVAGGALTWSVGTLSSGGQATLSLIVQTTTNGTLITSASVTATEPDPNPANNSASATTTVTAPFVSLVAATATLTAESGPVNGAIDNGETVTVFLRLRNVGNVSVGNVVGTLLATDGVAPVPPNSPQTFEVLSPSDVPKGRPFSFTASGANGGIITPTLQLQAGTNTYPPVSFTFVLPYTRLFTNTSVILIPDPAAQSPPYSYEEGSGPAKPYPSSIPVSGFSGTLGRVAVTLSNVSHTYPGDINALVVAPGGAKALLMSHAGDQPAAGLDLTFDDTAASPLPATGVLTAGAWRPGVYNPAPQLGGFPSNAPAGPYTNVLSVFNNVNANGVWSLYVFDDGAGDGGSISNGWSLALTRITPVNQLADLSLAGTATPNPGQVSGTITYIFTVTNAGPNPATSVFFTNNLPAGLTLLSSSPSQGAVASLTTNGVTLSLDTLDAGAVATVTNVVTVTGTAIPAGLTNAPLTNTATVVAFEMDLNLVNNTASVVTTNSRPRADLALGMTVAPSDVAVGYPLTNIVAITNLGPGTAFNVTLTEPLPSGASFLPGSSSSTVGSPTNIGGIVTCALGDLASNANASVTIVLSSPTTGSLTGQVSVRSDSYPTLYTTNYVATVTNAAPQIIAAGAVLTSESIVPFNGVIDPNETVTLSLLLANVGTRDTVNLQATLLATNGVTNPNPSGPQSYGVLGRGGSSVARSFTFKAASVLSGGAVVATLQLQDATGLSAPVEFRFPSLATTNFASAAAITIPDHGVATPYPSIINVSDLAGRINGATVTLNGFAHQFPHDVSVLLVSPSGTSVLLMSHAGGSYSTNSLTLTFDDAAPVSLANWGPLGSGTYQPSSYEGAVTLPGTGPAKNYQHTLSALNWGNPNGAWKLYVYDDTVGDSGVIAGGWSLRLTNATTVGPVVRLAVNLSAPGAIDFGSALTNAITVTNAGPDTATGVVLTLTNSGSASVGFVSASPQGIVTSSGDGFVNCSLGAIPPGSAANVIIVTAPSAMGVVTGRATVAASEENLGSSSAQATTIVSGPPILSGVYTNSHFQLHVTGEPNATYVVQASTNFTLWVSLSTNTTATGTFTYTDTTAPAPPLRFYRTVRR